MKYIVSHTILLWLYYEFLLVQYGMFTHFLQSSSVSSEAIVCLSKWQRINSEVFELNWLLTNHNCSTQSQDLKQLWSLINNNPEEQTSWGNIEINPFLLKSDPKQDKALWIINAFYHAIILPAGYTRILQTPHVEIQIQLCEIVTTELHIKSDPSIETDISPSRASL